MKKRLFAVLIMILTIGMFAGCSMNKIEYDMNLGYDLNQMKYKDITFNVYHSNTEDHKWELIASFPCDPKSGHYNDVKLQCSDDFITAVLKNNTKTESEDGKTVSYDGIIEASYEFEIEGFEGFLPGWESFDIENKEGEQFVRIYPISNDGGTLFNNINLEEPYDSNNENIDNILITIVMQ